MAICAVHGDSLDLSNPVGEPICQRLSQQAAPRPDRTIVHDTSLGPTTAPDSHNPADLFPRTLAVMRISSFTGDAAALQRLADSFQAILLAATDLRHYADSTLFMPLHGSINFRIGQVRQGTLRDTRGIVQPGHVLVAAPSERVVHRPAFGIIPRLPGGKALIDHVSARLFSHGCFRAMPASAFRSKVLSPPNI
jgi:hypothetical protein